MKKLIIKKININHVWIRMWNNKHIKWFVIDENLLKNTITSDDIIIKSTSSFNSHKWYRLPHRKRI